jgi:two-component system, OmpR family, response regulator MprA
MATILVVEDDRSIRESLKRALTLAGHEVITAEDGEAGLAAGTQSDIDLILMDWMMPKQDGVEVTKALRRKGVATPILFLTAKSGIGDRVDGLDAGADDFVSKPAALDELLARIRALLRRPEMDGAQQSRVEAHGIVIDQQRRSVSYQDQPLSLTKTEFDLLFLLMCHVGKVLPSSQIYMDVWGYDFGPGSKNLAVYVSYLRRKLEQVGAPDIIQANRGVGYGIKAL